MSTYPRGRTEYPGIYPGIVTYPPLPYVGAIGHTLQEGEMIIIQGSVPANPKQFLIHLQCGSYDGVDIAMCVNPRFEGANVVVRVSFRSGSWEAEERAGGFPLNPGAPFELILLVQSHCYKIAFNGKHFAEFRHRMPKEVVNTLKIEGTVNIETIRFQPPPGQPSYERTMPSAVPPPAYSLMVPYSSAIPGGLQPGRMIILSGVPTLSEDSFAINLVQGKNQAIAFHFNPRFNVGVVVRNSHLYGSWGPEERQQPCFPFKRNKGFDIIILCEQQQFKVAVDNKHFITYAHRVLDLYEIDTINVNGGLRLTNVQIQ